MVDLGVALTWIAISAASAKGLSVFARAAATIEVEEEMVVLTDDLHDVSCESLVRPFGRRHPTLPVLAVGARPCASGQADADMARP
jgi:hypothetical protein